MPTYAVLADVDGGAIQNAQELATLWGEIEADIEDAGGTVSDSYVVAGGYDLLLIYDVEDTEMAIQVAIAIQRHGLDTRTLPILPIEGFGDLVDDV